MVEIGRLTVGRNTTLTLKPQEFGSKNSGRDPPGVWRQDKLIAGKPPVAK
jgi:hypothetical protein